MRLGDCGQLGEGHVCDTCAHVNLSGGDQIERFFEGYFDKVAGLHSVLVLCVGDHESDVFFEIAPLWVGLLDALVVEAEVVRDDVLDARRVRALQAQVKKTALLREEPLAKLLVAAVCEAADEVRDVVILALLDRFCVCVRSQLQVAVKSVVLAFVRKAMLGQVLVHCQLDLVFLIGIKPMQKAQKRSQNHYPLEVPVKLLAH